MTKTVAISALLISAVAVGGLLYKDTFNFGNTIYEKQTVEVVVEKEVDTLDKLIKDAQNAKSDAIRDAGEQARKEAEEKMLDSIELEVRANYRKELEAKEIELEKKSGF